MIIWKGEALGNDYLVVERNDLPWPLTPARCAAICDRHTGLGSDGILIRDASHSEGFRLQILNPDGSEAEKSGNGLRIFGAYLHGLGLVGGDWFTVHLVKDSVRMRIEGPAAATNEGLPLDIRVEMGKASFRGADVGFTVPGSAAAFTVADSASAASKEVRRGSRESGAVVRASDGDEVLGHRLPLPRGGEAEINTVSLSNPHCVVLVDTLDRDDFLMRAPQLCTHPAFARGTNVQFAQVVQDGVLSILIWERGVGETLASGSSACAAAAAAVRRGRMASGRIEVRMPGGTAEVEVLEEYDIRLRGPARMVYRAEVTPTTLEAWARLD